MSMSAPLAERCPNCGSALPQSARFCPSCGAPVDEERAEALPLQVAGETSLTFERVEPRWFGIAPPYLLLGLTLALLVVAIVLFASGRWPYGLIVLGVAALVLAAFLEAVRRRPSARRRRNPVAVRERAQSAVETWRVRSFAAAEARRLRSAITLLEHDRRGLHHDLGAAVHRGDAAVETDVRARLAALEAHEAELRAQLDASLAYAGERIRQARLPVQETMMVMPVEPTPPPGEGNPPEPARIPEPYPPPDEGTPPQPARIPEPSPDPGPDPGREE